MRKSGTNTQPMEPDCETVRRWKEFSERYESKVFSVTSFPARRQKILRGVLPGIVADLGCGPLGLMLREICGLANTVVIGTDFCWEMLVESKRHTKECDVHYVLADNRCLPFQDRSIDTVVSVNSFLPESREEVESIFQQVARVLRRGGRLVALLPSFEMSLIARDKWEMPLRLDLDNHREWDTSGWQCFYTRSDIDELAQHTVYTSTASNGWCFQLCKRSTTCAAFMERVSAELQSLKCSDVHYLSIC